jgi:membrane protease YdiL (CAAX protease family)
MTLYPVLALLCFCLSAILLVPFEQFGLGLPVWLVGVAAVWATRSPILKRRLGVLLGCVLLLALAPINTSIAGLKFITLGLPFFAVIALPYWLLRGDDELIVYRLWPKQWSHLEVGYVLLSIPLAWAAFRLYFGVLSPEIPYNWKLPEEPDGLELVKLFMGINGVGIWDELFFINTSFAILRSLFPFWGANLAQSVLYTAVLYDMAFRGWGPLFVLALALTQGIMFERSRVLIYVLAVHLIVDYFLFQEIVEAYYPGFSAWWHP